MASLIVLIIFGLGVAYFAIQNTGNVHILFDNYVLTSIPLYVVVIGSLLLGVFISWLISFIDTFSTLFTLYRKDTAIKKYQQTIDKLEKENHDMEVEIARLTGEKHPQENQQPKENQSFFNQIKHNFGMT